MLVALAREKRLLIGSLALFISAKGLMYINTIQIFRTLHHLHTSRVIYVLITMSADIVNIFLVAAVLWGIHSATRKKQETNPPGPKPLPLIGNVLNFPVNRQWVTFAEWKKQYGK
jgi:hypothetical protein